MNSTERVKADLTLLWHGLDHSYHSQGCCLSREQAQSQIGTFYQHESTQARLYHLESLLQCSKWSMHPAKCGCVDRAVVEQLSFLHQCFYSNLYQNLMDSTISPFLFFFFYLLSGFDKIPFVILLKGQAVTNRLHLPVWIK